MAFNRDAAVAFCKSLLKQEAGLGGYGHSDPKADGWLRSAARKLVNTLSPADQRAVAAGVRPDAVDDALLKKFADPGLVPEAPCGNFQKRKTHTNHFFSKSALPLFVFVPFFLCVFVRVCVCVVFFF